MKCPHSLKVFPPSLKKIIALIAACTTKKEIRNNPVRAIVYFLVKEDLKIPFAIVLIIRHENNIYTDKQVRINKKVDYLKWL
jgi:glycerol-3-phosphate acyltransferase PlsY